MKWRERAACKGLDPTPFFEPIGTGRIPSQGRTRPVIEKFCNNCEVKEECLNYSIKERIRYGIWGGVEEGERWKMIGQSDV